MRYELRINGIPMLAQESLDDFLFLLWDYIGTYQSANMYVRILRDSELPVSVNVLRFLMALACGEKVEALFVPSVLYSCEK